jgi:hypothetical protein
MVKAEGVCRIVLSIRYVGQPGLSVSLVMSHASISTQCMSDSVSQVGVRPL